jgi:hypothetical protein
VWIFVSQSYKCYKVLTKAQNHLAARDVYAIKSKDKMTETSLLSILRLNNSSPTIKLINNVRIYLPILLHSTWPHPWMVKIIFVRYFSNEWISEVNCVLMNNYSYSNEQLSLFKLYLLFKFYFSLLSHNTVIVNDWNEVLKIQCIFIGSRFIIIIFIKGQCLIGIKVCDIWYLYSMLKGTCLGMIIAIV